MMTLQLETDGLPQLVNEVYKVDMGMYHPHLDVKIDVENDLAFVQLDYDVALSVLDNMKHMRYEVTKVEE